jgi:hypothetical protein
MRASQHRRLVTSLLDQRHHVPSDHAGATSDTYPHVLLSSATSLGRLSLIRR